MGGNSKLKKIHQLLLSLIGIFLVVTGILKFLSLDKFVDSYRVLLVKIGIETLAHPLGYLLLVVEAVAGFLLLFRQKSYTVIISVAILFFLFLIINLFSILNCEQSCGCFGDALALAPETMFFIDLAIFFYLVYSVTIKE